EHGNRNDAWNSVNFDGLRRYRSVLSRRQERFPDAEFHPPPGSRLVERIMNPIKTDYPFIDLLKPETEAAIPLLLALEPSLARDIETIGAFDQLWSEAKQQRPRAPAVPSEKGNIGGRS